MIIDRIAHASIHKLANQITLEKVVWKPECNFARLIESLRRISLVANDKSGGVQLHLEPGLLRIQSQNPGVLDGSMHLYTASMMGPSPLSRAQREALATAVSRANDCHY